MPVHSWNRSPDQSNPDINILRAVAAIELVKLRAKRRILAGSPNPTAILSVAAIDAEIQAVVDYLAEQERAEAVRFKPLTDPER